MSSVIITPWGKDFQEDLTAYWKSRSQNCYDRQSVGQSVFVSDTMCGLPPGFYYCQIFAALLMWGALSDERTGVPFTIAAGFDSAVIRGAETRGTHYHMLLSQMWESPNFEGQVPVFIFPRKRVTQLDPPSTGFPFHSPQRLSLLP
jgi:hypothetical protein